MKSSDQVWLRCSGTARVWAVRAGKRFFGFLFTLALACKCQGMQCHCSVHSADPFVVPSMSLVSQIIAHLATTPARLPVCQLAEFLDNRLICCFLWLVAIDTTTHLHCPTCLSLTQSKFRNCITGQLTSLCYLESFFRR